MINSYFIWDCKLWDFTGEDRSQSHGQVFYQGSDAAIVMYDTTAVATFENVPRWINSFREIIQTEVPVFVVGNKIEEPGRVVTEEMAEELCEKYGEKCYSAFVDAKYSLNINNLMDCILRTINGEEVFRTKPREVKSARNVGKNPNKFE